MMTTTEIKSDMQMQEIMQHYPGAKRALFQKYHIGGCSSCGFSPTDTLEQVFVNHHRPTEVPQAINWILESARLDAEMQIAPTQLKQEMDDWKVIDVREEFEAEQATIPGSHLLTRELAYEMMQKWPKDTKIAFYCHTGMRSLEAAVYFKGHGLPNVKSLSGGIDRWAQEVDTSIPRY